MPKLSFGGIWEILKNSFAGFAEDKVPKLSASLAYYTIFSMGPLILLLIYTAGFFFGREAIEGNIYGQLRSFVGPQAALQIQEVVKNASLNEQSNTAAIIGVVTLLIGATTVFAEIQDSINTIWGLKAKPSKQGWLIMLKNRLLSFGVIGSLGFLLLVSLVITAVIQAINTRLQNLLPGMGYIIMFIINMAFTLVVITLLFMVIFKVLPDANIRWKDVIAGSLTTAILFMIGKFAISFYIGQSDVGSTYGTAGSLVVLILWVYYSSIILYFGAEFTKAYAMKYGSDIRPNHYAVVVKNVTVEGGQDSLRNHARNLETAKTDGKIELRRNPPPPQPVGKPEGLGSPEVLRSLAVLLVDRLVDWGKTEQRTNNSGQRS